MMTILVSGLINIETTVAVREFPIPYYPIDYPFFGVSSAVSGVAFNIARALRALGDDVDLHTFVGPDDDGRRVLDTLARDGIDDAHVRRELRQTAASVVLYDPSGRRQVYCDLKDVQDMQLPVSGPAGAAVRDSLETADIVVACNTNFNRDLLRAAREAGKPVATDVHVLDDIGDEYNRDFMAAADMLFLSDERLPEPPADFARRLADRYGPRIVVIGMGGKGAMLHLRNTDETWMLPAAPTTKVVNTVGAGDALFSAFLHGVAGGLAPLEALRRAELFAAHKIGFSGASVGFCDAAELDAMAADPTLAIEPERVR